MKKLILLGFLILSANSYANVKLDDFYLQRSNINSELNMDTEVGFDLYRSIQIYYRHYPNYTLDSQNKGYFPYNNSFGIRYYVRF